MPETLLQTKLHIPVTRNNLVPRSHLWERLNTGLECRLTLVSAPAGFGKTTLIAHWARQIIEAEEWQLAWFSLDANDNELSRFFEYFIAALQKVEPILGRSALELLRSPQAINIQIVMTNLINTLSNSSRPIIIVLDDYHFMTDPDIHENLVFLLENAPPYFHLVINTRADPPFSLARMRARNQLTEIRQADLRFSTQETSEFLNQLMSLGLPETAIAALEKRTEGWAVGLQMAALSLQGQEDFEAFIRDFTGSNRFVLDYLAEEVLAQRPKGTRDFLLQTAVLDRMCAPLCDAVLGLAETNDSHSQRILEQLASVNLFLIHLDSERRWYRYHHLFADLLKQQSSQEMPDQARVAHERASRWFEQAGYEEEAVQHALTANDEDRALSLVAKYSENWLKKGEIGKIMIWTERLPVDWRHKNPRLILNYAWALLHRGRAKEAEATLAQLPQEFAETSIDLLVLKGTLAAGRGQIVRATTLLEKAEAQLKSFEPNTSNQTLRGKCALNLALIYHIKGDGWHAQQKYEIAAAINREVGNWFGIMNAMRGWSRVLVEQARLHEADTIIHDGLLTERQWAGRLGHADRKLVAAAPLHISLGQLYYEWNRLDEAEAQLVDAVKVVAVSDSQGDGLAALAKLRLAQGKVEAIPAILEQLEEIRQTAKFPIVRQALSRALATTRCALYRQQLTPELRTAIEQSLSQLAAAGDTLTQARALVTLDRFQEALSLLEKRAAQTEANESYGLWLPAAVLLCVTYQRMGEKNSALTWLQGAVQMAEAPGYIRLFLDEGEPLRQLLGELVQQKDAPIYASTLLTYFSSITPPITPPPNSAPLSPREREVLQLIASGLTNKEIANKLVIAPSTAKRHIVNIYNKLGINNRAEATARAYEMGLVNLE